MTTDPTAPDLPPPAQPGGTPGNPDAATSIGDPAISEWGGQTTTHPTATPATAAPPVDPPPAPAPPPAPTPRAGRPAADRSTGELVRTLTDTVRSLVQGEVANAQQEMTEKARAAQPAAAMLGGAALLGALAAGTSAVVVVRVLDKVLPPVASAALATALLGGGTAALAAAGAEQLRRVGPPVPERTIESVKADVAAVTEATPG